MSGSNIPSVQRLFMAIGVPPEVRAEMAKVQDHLRRQCPSGSVRWSPPAQFHLTLLFLGDVAAEQIESLKQSMAAVCAGFSAMELTAQAVGFFPNIRDPRVVWVGVADELGRLAVLHEYLTRAARPFVPEIETGKFAGHVTLGRVTTRRSPQMTGLIEAAKTAGGKTLGRWHAEAVGIFQSELTPNGARHVRLMACPFRK